MRFIKFYCKPKSEGETPVACELIRLTQKNDRREFKGGRSGMIGYKSGAGKAAVPFTTHKVSARIFLVKTELEPGEYGFFRTVSGTLICYSFKVD
jgi:hypothetical protein